MRAITGRGKNWRRINLAGKRFGKLVVLGICERDELGHIKWLCKCDCGQLKSIRASSLTRTRSCGCFRGVRNGQEAHGATHTDEYNAYRLAKDRCNRVKNVGYNNYGGRGIEFRFTSFSQWLNELGKRPSKQHSVDRIDNNGHYEPGNVRWATKAEQSNNRRNALHRYCPHCRKEVFCNQWLKSVS